MHRVDAHPTLTPLGVRIDAWFGEVAILNARIVAAFSTNTLGDLAERVEAASRDSRTILSEFSKVNPEKDSPLYQATQTQLGHMESALNVASINIAELKGRVRSGPYRTGSDEWH